MSKFYSLLLGIICLSWWGFPDIGLGKSVGERKNSKSVKKEVKSTLIFPLQGKSLEDVISGYGDSRAQGKRIHKGIDIPAPRGTKVLSVQDGLITKVANKGNAGKQVWVRSDTVTYFYAHLDSWKVEEGQKVKQGDIIGTVGNTGNASKTLPHLHFGVYIGRGKTIDPVNIFVGTPRH